MSKTDRPELSVLIPAFNEEKSLAVLLPKIKDELGALAVSFEIVVVDGGSSDKTVAVAEGHGARVIRQEAPGFGGAVRDGFKASRGEHILEMDADGSHPPEMIPKLWKAKRWADLVIASRYIPGGAAELDLQRRVLSGLLNLVCRWWLGWTIRDASSGLRIYRGDAIRGAKLASCDFTIQQEGLAAVLAGGGKATEIPFHYALRIGGESKARVVPLAWGYLKMLFRLKPKLLGCEASGALAVVLVAGLATGLWGLSWGLPGPQRLNGWPESMAPSAEMADRLTKAWAKLYEDIRRSHAQMQSEEPVTYLRGVEVVAPGWSFPPANLTNSLRSFLLQSVNPDEKKAFIILAQMRPWKLEFQPLYVQYGGGFVYPLGAWLWLSTHLGAGKLVPDMSYYLQHPDQMGRLYLLARAFIVLFQLGSLWLIFDIGRRLSGWRTGLFAGLFFALCPTIVINSHLIKPHPYGAFWALAAASWLFLAAERGICDDYLFCGLAAGMAAGSNFTLVPLVGLPVLGWLWRWGRRDELGRAFAASLAGLALCVALNPYLLMSYRSYAWELEVYAAGSLKFSRLDVLLTGPRLFWRAVQVFGPAPAVLLAAGLVAGLARSGRRLTALVGLGLCAAFFARFAGATDVSALRLYYFPIALACVLGADLLFSPCVPKAARAAVLLLVLGDAGVRSFVYLRNMSLDGAPSSVRARAAEWIAQNVPTGGTVGLMRYPEPSWTPPFELDRYKLVLAAEPDQLEDAQRPDFFVLDEPRTILAPDGRSAFEPAAAFEPYSLLWAKPVDLSGFANRPLWIVKKKA